MRFFLKHYVHAVSARRCWLLLLFIPPLAYLLITTIIPDRFSIEQEISIPKNASVQFGKKPGSYLPMSDIASQPESFFQDGFALILLKRELNPDTILNPTKAPLGRLRMIVENSMTLTLKGEKTAVVVYKGEDRDLGKKLVAFYSQRLFSKIKAGGPRIHPEDRNQQPSASLIGQPKITDHRAFWRSERLFPSLVIAAISLFVILIIIALIEWLDPSFRSERQLARYLGLPIIGSVPNLKKISDAMSSDNQPTQVP